MLSREHWIAACEFAASDDAQVLGEVIERTRRLLSGRERPVVVFDLDSTLYEVKTRTFRILREWIDAHRDSPVAAALVPLMGDLEQAQVGYSLKDTLRAVGASLDSPEVESAMQHMKSFWMERFFSNPYLAFDEPYPGAASYVKRVHDAGAHVVYLTGRDEPGMGEGTRERLRRDGFPFDAERTGLFLKPEFRMDDMKHKQNAAAAVRQLGSVVASFENEPRNLAALHELLPEAMHVFVETDYSDHPAPILKGLYRLRRWV